MTGTPTDEQFRAITAGTGLVRTQSGAGTGKTFMLTHRLKWLAEQGVPPSRILAVSFTRASANELGERAVALNPGMPAPVTSTIHSMAVRLLRAFGPLAIGTEGRWGVADSDTTEPIFRDITTKWVEENLGRGYAIDEIQDLGVKGITRQVMKKARQEIDSWKERMISPAQAIERFCVPDGDLSNQSMHAQLYQLLQEGLHEHSTLEISDLIPEAVRMLEARPDVADRVSSAFQHVLVDEFQDVNFAQVRLIQYLTSGHRNLTIVGDSDQSIYLFRHAIPNAMERAPEFFPLVAAVGVEDHVLTINRRNPEAVLRCASMLVDFNPRSAPKDLRSGKPGDPPKLMNYGNDNQEAASVISQIRKLIAGGTPPSEIAVLSRAGSLLTKIVAQACAMKVPHEVTSGLKFMERRQVRDLMAWLRLALNPACPMSFERAAGAPSRGLGLAAIKTVRNYAEANSVNFIDALRGCVSDGLVRKTSKAGEMADLIEDLVRMAEDPGVSPEMMIREVLDRTAYATWAMSQSERPDQVRDTINIFVDLAGNMNRAGVAPNLVKFLDDITLAEDVQEEHGAVRIGTIHSSKGLEWSHVFLIGIEAGVTPSYQSSEPMGEISDEYDPWDDRTGCLEEERRLLYVAATRGKTRVYLTTARERANRPGKSRPSPFLVEMGIMSAPSPTDGFEEDGFSQVRLTPRRQARMTARPRIVGPSPDMPDPSP